MSESRENVKLSEVFVLCAHSGAKNNSYIHMRNNLGLRAEQVPKRQYGIELCPFRETAKFGSNDSVRPGPRTDLNPRLRN